ncbi:MAG: hypothetical protein JWQ79_1728 [Mucilaginibacter sp.]|nr:hypothetical protein [Mucilaginibacter sp.]
MHSHNPFFVTLLCNYNIPGLAPSIGGISFIKCEMPLLLLGTFLSFCGWLLFILPRCFAVSFVLFPFPEF